MAENEKSTENAAKANAAKAEPESGGRRFRLPKLFADSADVARSADLEMANLALNENVNTPAPEPSGQSALDIAERAIAERAIAMDVSLPPAIDPNVISTANRVFEGSPRASVLRVPEGGIPEPHMKSNDVAPPGQQPDVSAPDDKRSNFAERVRLLAAPDADAPDADAPDADAPDSVALAANSDFAGDASLPTSTSSASTSSASTSSDDAAFRGVAPGAFVPAPFQPVPIAAALSDDDSEALGGAILNEIMQLRDGMEEMNRTLLEMSDRGDTQEKVFNTLHSELQDYKNDFIYEHLKPVVRPLLFLFDSMEQFDGELTVQMLPQPDERRRGLSPLVVRQNVSFFREQLVEALRICEVTPMATPEGEFDAKLHKAVETVAVEEIEDGRIVRVVRSGWYLNGRVFRPAEVVVGKKSEDANAHLWTHGNSA